MKKEYIKPTAEIEKIITEAIIATSIKIEEDLEEGEAGANKHRGQWGDVWSK